MPGLTAYVGLLDMAGFTDGDTVFVSGAAGAVGSVVGQIAKAKGAARVIGSAGSAAKVDHLHAIGFDAGFNYKDGKVGSLLREAAPDGIDVYFDNVGTDHLEAALTSLKPFGRVAMCGAIAAYNVTEAPASPRNLAMVVGKRLTLRGFIVSDHYARLPAFVATCRLVGLGKIRCGDKPWGREAPDAFLGLMRGENIGKMIVRV